MKNPSSFDQRERDLTPFVLAAKSTYHQAALDLLFIHARDLAWGDERFGLYLFESASLHGHERALSLAKARAGLGGVRLAKTLTEFLRPKLVEWTTVALKQHLERGAPEGDVDVSGVLAEMLGASREKLLKEMLGVLPDLMGQLGFLVDGAAYTIVQESQERRQRQLAASGITDERYTEMLVSLFDVGVLQPVIRVLLPPGERPELSLTTEARFTSESFQVPSMEVLRVGPDIEALKIGADNALGIFVSAYLNAHALKKRVSFASARYGDRDGAELDVVVPELSLGMEVKVYNAPYVAGAHSAETHAQKLSSQLMRYIGAGCERVFFVTNLRPVLAREVAERAAKIAQLPENGIEVVAGGAAVLLQRLNTLLQELRASLETSFEAEVRGRVGIERAETTTPTTEDRAGGAGEPGRPDSAPAQDVDATDAAQATPAADTPPTAASADSALVSDDAL